MLLETCDGLIHKVNILENHKNEFAESKDGSLVFVMINNGRRFTLTTKDGSDDKEDDENEKEEEEMEPLPHTEREAVVSPPDG